MLLSQSNQVLHFIYDSKACSNVFAAKNNIQLVQRYQINMFAVGTTFRCPDMRSGCTNINSHMYTTIHNKNGL